MHPRLAADVWPEVEGHLRGALAEFFQLPFASARPECARHASDELFVADVSLSEPTAQLELTLSVVVGRASMTALAGSLLGDDGVEGARELFLEVANIFMGTLKTTFLGHGLMFTGGLPTVGAVAATEASFERCPVGRRFVFDAPTAEAVAVAIRVHEKRNTLRNGAELVEGLVAHGDICGPSGAVLVLGGSRLTRTAIEHLREALPDGQFSVSDPGA